MFNNKIDNTFHCPSDFEKETLSPQLFYEDMDENSELWLIRMPNDMDPSLIENQDIILDGNLHTLNSVKDCPIPYEYSSNEIEASKLCMILPERETGDLKNVKHIFKGSLFVNEGILNNFDSEIKMEVSDMYEEQNNSANSTDNTFLSNEMDFDELPSKKRKEGKHKKKKSSQGKKLENKMGILDDFPKCMSQT